MARKRQGLTVVLGFRASRREAVTLRQLAQRRGVSPSKLIRELLRWALLEQGMTGREA